MPEFGQNPAEKRRRLERLVDDERDRRLALPLQYNQHRFQFGPDSRENIMGAANTAMIAITMNGAQQGDLYWHGEITPFVFLDRDNNPVPMDAYQMVAFGQAAARWKSQHIFAARQLKDMPTIPADFTEDLHWP